MGGGSSALAQSLLDEDFNHVAVLDISPSALLRAQARLGERASNIQWIEADVTSHQPLDQVDVWHDRAVFHFLVDPAQRRSYVQLASKTVAPGGHAILATFGPEGPTHCSGLPVVRHGERALAAEFEPAFRLLDASLVDHATPAGITQQFIYGFLQRT